MKVISSWYRISIALHRSTLSGGFMNRCQQMWTFPDVFICAKKSMFSGQ